LRCETLGAALSAQAVLEIITTKLQPQWATGTIIVATTNTDNQCIFVHRKDRSARCKIGYNSQKKEIKNQSTKKILPENTINNDMVVNEKFI